MEVGLVLGEGAALWRRRGEREEEEEGEESGGEEGARKEAVEERRRRRVAVVQVPASFSRGDVGVRERGVATARDTAGGE